MIDDKKGKMRKRNNKQHAKSLFPVCTVFIVFFFTVLLLHFNLLFAFRTTCSVAIKL